METIMIARIQAISLELSKAKKEVVHIQVQPITNDGVFYDYFFSNEPKWSLSKRRAEFLYATDKKAIDTFGISSHEPVVTIIVADDLAGFIDKEIEIIYTDSNRIKYITYPFHKERWLKQMEEASK